MFTSKDYTPKKRTVPFIRVNGRLIRDIRGTEVVVRSVAPGNSLGKFAKSVGRISYHKWA